MPASKAPGRPSATLRRSGYEAIRFDFVTAAKLSKLGVLDLATEAPSCTSRRGVRRCENEKEANGRLATQGGRTLYLVTMAGVIVAAAR